MTMLHASGRFAFLTMIAMAAQACSDGDGTGKSNVNLNGDGGNVPTPAAEGGSQTTQTDCETCVASGGTWQPEVDDCTQNCEIQDISCFTDQCPGDCATDCGSCFDQGECEANGCVWQQSAEAMWCTNA